MRAPGGSPVRTELKSSDIAPFLCLARISTAPTRVPSSLKSAGMHGPPQAPPFALNHTPQCCQRKHTCLYVQEKLAKERGNRRVPVQTMRSRGKMTK
jgi:hypothetical protein